MTQPPENTPLPEENHAAPPPGENRRPLFPTVNPRRFENFMLNIVLYVGSLLLVSAAALFITEVAPVALRIGLLALGAVVFYTTGLVLYLRVGRLRIASYSFTATGIALIPLVGIATYILLWHNGVALWFITSLVGTLAVAFASRFMQSRVMAYLFISFLVSDTLSASKVFDFAFIWYFVVLLVLATALKIFLTYLSPRLPRSYERGLLDASYIFVPAITCATVALYNHFEYWELALIFALETGYAIFFFLQEKDLLFYIQARIYPVVTATTVALWVGENGSLSPYTPWAVALLALLLSWVVIYTWSRTGGNQPVRLSVAYSRKHPILNPDIDLYITLWVSSALLVLTELIHTQYLSDLGLPTVQRGSLRLFWLSPIWSAPGNLDLAPWVLPVCVIVAIGFLKPRLTRQLFLPLALVTGLVPTLIIHINGGSLILLSLALILLVTEKTNPQAVVYRVLGTIVLAAALILGIYSIYTDLSFPRLLLIVAFVLSGASIYLALRHRENPAQGEPSYSAILSIPLIAGIFALFSAFNHTSAFGQDLAHLSASTAFFVVLYVLTTAMISLALQVLGEVSYSTGRDNPGAAVALLGTALFLFSVAFAPGFAASVRIIEPIALITTLIAGAFLFRALLLQVTAIYARILLGWITVLLVLDNYRGSSSLVLLIFFLAISLSSFFLYRYSSFKRAELVIGTVSLWLSLPTLLYVLEDHGDGWSDIGYWLLALAVAAVWTLSKRKAVLPVLGAILFATLFRILVQIVIDRDYPRGLTAWNSPPVLLLFGTLAIAAIALVTAMLMPDFESRSSGEKPSRSAEPAPATNTAAGLPGRLDPRRNRLLSITVLIPVSITVGITQHYSRSSLPAALGIFLLFVLWGMVSRPHVRVGVWVAGLGIALIRAYGMYNYDGEATVFIIFLESISVLFMAVSAAQIYRHQKLHVPYDQIHSWIAWGILALTTAIQRAEVADHPASFSPQLLLILLSIGVLFLAFFQRTKVLGVFSAALITYHIIRIFSGANPLTLLILGAALIGFVIFRLLTRAGDPDEDSQPSFFVRHDDDNDPPAETAQQSAPVQQSVSPWDPPQNQETLPWKDPDKK